MERKFPLFTQVLQDKVFRFAWRLLESKEDAKDVVQDVFEKLWTKKDELKTHLNIDALIIKITRDICLDRLKHQQMKRQKLKLLAHEKDPDQKTNYDVYELAEITKKLISNLPEKQKMAIHLRDVEQYEYNEISEILEMDIATIRMNLSRARRTIREQLQNIE